MEAYKEALKELQKEPLSLRNRLNSILIDAMYVTRFQELGYPIVANERCGLWYVKPDLLAESAYFKSTDGHTSQWKFSLRRLNLHLLSVLRDNGGIVLVDSTRKGKLMPDALSKTVPIWCAVLNYIIFEGESLDNELARDNWLRTPRAMVSASEHSSISNLIPGFAAEVKRLQLVTKEDLVKRLGAKKPLIPSWCYPGQNTALDSDSLECFEIVCVTASAASKRSPSSWSYVQGAADDHELWATKDVCDGKLDAQLFWRIAQDENEDSKVVDPDTQIIYEWLSETQLVERMNAIHNKLETNESTSLDITQLGHTGVSIGAIDRNVSYSQVTGYDAVVVLSRNYNVERPPKDEKQATVVLSYPVAEGKKGSKELREAIPKIMQSISGAQKVAVLCDTGKDLSIAIALCILCRRFDINWEPSDENLVNKDIVKQHLQKISDYRKVNPSRNTLQSVNTYLMGR